MTQHEFRLRESTYTLTASDETLAQLAPEILSRLGCSYEIRWPARTEDDRARRATDRMIRRDRLRFSADTYASDKAYDLVNSDDLDTLREALQDAYKAGYAAAPKGPNSK